MKRLFIGTSGWSYKSWAGSFYPEKLPAARQFDHYATRFPTVEINATFYRLPSRAMVKGWAERAPRGFVFVVKGSRFITHMKKLKVTKRSIGKFFTRIKPLRRCLGPILWQLPPNLKKDLQRLERFLRQLPPGHRYAVEFRHPSWIDEEIFALLRKHKVAQVAISSTAMPMVHDITTDFVYMRFHGLAGGAAHDYSRTELKPWAAYCRKALRKRFKVFAFFNNDANTRAPQNAELLQEMITGSGGK